MHTQLTGEKLGRESPLFEVRPTSLTISFYYCKEETNDFLFAIL